mmetsp:Transcript_69913/g.123706  ORF Transcript_69913/g.123706 Transcript_69913/m.123706 type:complete len:211 (+) Transcript_69913:743-1375(+)
MMSEPLLEVHAAEAQGEGTQKKTTAAQGLWASCSRDVQAPVRNRKKRGVIERVCEETNFVKLPFPDKRLLIAQEVMLGTDAKDLCCAVACNLQSFGLLCFDHVRKSPVGRQCLAIGAPHLQQTVLAPNCDDAPSISWPVWWPQEDVLPKRLQRHVQLDEGCPSDNEGVDPYVGATVKMRTAKSKSSWRLTSKLYHAAGVCGDAKTLQIPP